MALLWAIIIGALIVWGSAKLARRLGIWPNLALLVPVGLVGLAWIGGSFWIASPNCVDVDTCDSGGWLAFSLSMVALAVSGAFGGIIARFLDP